jgi:polysaccharide biosynthesis/export protein
MTSRLIKEGNVSMKAALATLVLLLLSIATMAQTPPGPKVNKIQIDDVLRIQVYGETQINAIEVPVTEDGYVSAPFVGSLLALGKTPGELETELVALYKAKLRIRDPKVSVTFAQIHPYRAFVSGAVQRPGQYQFRPGDTLLTLVAQGGDPVDGAADLHRAVLTHKGSEEGIPIDLYALLRKADYSQNYELQDGDKLEIPSDSRNTVQVLGFVQRPGSLVFREPMTLADAISGAGGEIPTKSMLSRVTIQRELPGSPGSFAIIKANFVAYEHGDSTQNVLLYPHDFIFVPATNTPDINTVANTINAAFLFQNFLRGGLFGFRFH